MFEASYFCPIHFPKRPHLDEIHPVPYIVSLWLSFDFYSTLLFVFHVPPQLLSSIPVVPNLAIHHNHWGTSSIHRLPHSLHTYWMRLSGVEHGAVFVFLSSPSDINNCTLWFFKALWTRIGYNIKSVVQSCYFSYTVHYSSFDVIKSKLTFLGRWRQWHKNFHS